MSLLGVTNQTAPSEAELVCRAVDQDADAIRTIIKIHNRRLYRLARSVVRDDGDAEDVLQESYVKAFSALSTFRGESGLATWLSRIVINEALQWKRRRIEPPVETSQARVIPFPLHGRCEVDPETSIAQRQVCALLEQAIDQLPDEFRTVLVARTIENMSVEETAELLALKPETVKTRLHRARRLLKRDLVGRVGPLFGDVFPFDGMRCERTASAVLKRLGI